MKRGGQYTAGLFGRLREAQRALVAAEAERLDRSESWVIRRCIDTLLADLPDRGGGDG